MAALYISKKNGNVFQDTFYEANFKVNYIGGQLSGDENEQQSRKDLFDDFLKNHKERTILTGRYIENEAAIDDLRNQFANQNNSAKRVEILEELYNLKRPFISDLAGRDEQNQLFEQQNKLREELREKNKEKDNILFQRFKDLLDSIEPSKLNSNTKPTYEKLNKRFKELKNSVNFELSEEDKKLLKELVSEYKPLQSENSNSQSKNEDLQSEYEKLQSEYDDLQDDKELISVSNILSNTTNKKERPISFKKIYTKNYPPISFNIDIYDDVYKYKYLFRDIKDKPEEFNNLINTEDIKSIYPELDLHEQKKEYEQKKEEVTTKIEEFKKEKKEQLIEAFNKRFEDSKYGINVFGKPDERDKSLSIKFKKYIKGLTNEEKQTFINEQIEKIQLNAKYGNVNQKLKEELKLLLKYKKPSNEFLIRDLKETKETLRFINEYKLINDFNKRFIKYRELIDNKPEEFLKYIKNDEYFFNKIINHINNLKVEKKKKKFIDKLINNIKLNESNDSINKKLKEKLKEELKEFKDKDEELKKEEVNTEIDRLKNEQYEILVNRQKRADDMILERDNILKRENTFKTSKRYDKLISLLADDIINSHRYINLEDINSKRLNDINGDTNEEKIKNKKFSAKKRNMITLINDINKKIIPGEPPVYKEIIEDEEFIQKLEKKLKTKLKKKKYDSSNTYKIIDDIKTELKLRNSKNSENAKLSSAVSNRSTSSTIEGSNSGSNISQNPNFTQITSETNTYRSENISSNNNISSLNTSVTKIRNYNGISNSGRSNIISQFSSENNNNNMNNNYNNNNYNNNINNMNSIVNYKRNNNRRTKQVNYERNNNTENNQANSLRINNQKKNSANNQKKNSANSLRINNQNNNQANSLRINNQANSLRINNQNNNSANSQNNNSANSQGINNQANNQNNNSANSQRINNQANNQKKNSKNNKNLGNISRIPNTTLPGIVPITPPPMHQQIIMQQQPIAQQPQSIVQQPQPIAQQPQSIAQQPQPIAQQPQPIAQQPELVSKKTEYVIVSPPKQQVKVQPKQQVKSQPKQQVKAQPKQQVKAQTKQQVKAQTKQQVKAQTKQQVKAQINQQTKEQQIKAQIIKNELKNEKKVMERKKKRSKVMPTKVQSEKKLTKLLDDKKFNKFLDSLSYDNSKLFGTEFKPLTKRQDCLKGECPIKFMLLNNRFNKKGNIKNIDDINKRYIWQYITYLRLYNKDNEIFKVEYKNVEYNKVSPQYLYLLVKTKLDSEAIKRTSINKDSLKTLLRKILKQKNIVNPLLNKV
jgi:hypothetical protein